MRISDWSSDVCSSDLEGMPANPRPLPFGYGLAIAACRVGRVGTIFERLAERPAIVGHGEQGFLADAADGREGEKGALLVDRARAQRRERHRPMDVADPILRFVVAGPIHGHSPRSEEHTSELRSLMRISYAVFCLKKKTHIPYIQ